MNVDIVMHRLGMIRKEDPVRSETFRFFPGLVPVLYTSGMSRVFLAFRCTICDVLQASCAWNDGEIIRVPGWLNIRIPDRIANLFFNRM